MPANHVLLQRITLTADTTSVTLSSIPQTGYTDLKLVVSARGTGSSQYIKVAFNGDTTAGNYGQKQISGNGSSPSSGSFARLIFEVNRSSYTASTFANCEAYIPNYTGSQYKSYSADSANETNGTTAYMTMCAGIWNNTAAITSVNFTIDTGDSFVAGSSFSLYGIANAATTPAAAPKADGGDIIKTDGTYWYHAFLGTSIFKPQLNLTCDVLQVAGGGGGGADGGAGGGAGGVLAFASQAFASGTPYLATVGAGGVGSAAAAATNTSGSNSQLGSLTACIGGGKGASYGVTSGANGGSGGGSGETGGTAGTATSGQGNNGGTNTIGSSAAGGGGKGGAGSSATVGTSGANGGNGGAGANTVTNWGTLSSAFTTLGMGVSGYIAGGGGGGGHSTSSTLNAGGTGGSGGGGNGGNYSNNSGARNVPTAGTASTGSGGGGDGWFAQGGKAGGSGFIIIRYPV